MSVLAVLVAAGVSLAGGGLSMLWGPRLGFVDVPDGSVLKVHRRPAVPLGGVGVFCGVHAALIVLGIFDPGLLIASAIVLALGLADDVVNLPPILRLSVETAAGATLVFFGTAVGTGGWVFAGLAIALVVVSINAVNLFDGLDGLVGLAGVAAALGVWWLSHARETDMFLGLVLAAALAGFLLLNWHDAKLFLGNNGSYVVGLFLAYGAISATQDGSVADLGIASGVLGVFILDLLVTVVRRRVARKPLFLGDRSHLYDQLVDRGLSVPRIVLLAGLVEACFVALVMIADQGVGGWGGVAVLASGTAVLFGLAVVGGFLASALG